MDERANNCECNSGYLLTVHGILKIVEIILTILTFALSFGGHWDGAGGGWVEFCGISCCITISIWLVLHMVIMPQLLVNYIFEAIIYCVMAVMLLISGIVAAVRSGELTDWARWYPEYYRQKKDTIGACSFFAFAAALTCGVDAVLQFLQYRRGGLQSSTMTSTTVTRTTTSAVKVEY